MRPIILITSLIGAAAAGFAWPANDRAAAEELDRALRAEYPAGAVVLIREAGIIAVNPECNIVIILGHKDGQLHPPGVMQRAMVNSNQCITRPLPPNWRVMVVSVAVAKNGNATVLFQECDPCNGPPSGSYKAAVTFQPPKSGLDPAAALNAVRSVFAPPPNTTPPPTAAVPPSPPPPRAALGSVYVSSQNGGDRLELQSTGGFSLLEGGQKFTGTYTAAGNTLRLQIAELGKTVDLAISGENLIVNGSEVWTQPSKRAAGIASGPVSLAPAYVNLERPGDRLDIHRDGTFTLDEGGQKFSGKYVVSGSTLRLHITELNTDADIQIEGKQLIVNGGERWAPPNMQ